MNPELLKILRCPLSGQALLQQESHWVTPDGCYRYPIINGIPRLIESEREWGSLKLEIMVFDFDDTLVKSEHIKTEGLYVVAAECGVSREEMEHFIAHKKRASRFEIFEDFLETFPDCGKSHEELVGRYAEYCENHIIAAEEVQGTEEFLKGIQGKIECCVNSATPQDALVDSIRKRSWEGYFQEVYGYPASKAEVLRNLMSKRNVRPGSVMMAGDSLADWEASQEAGCRFLGIGEKMKDLSEKEGFPAAMSWIEVSTWKEFKKYLC